MIRALLLIALLFTARSAHALDPWTKTDTAMQVTVSSIIVIDWLQTRSSVKTGGFHELNPVLGAHPDIPRVNAIIGSSLAATWIVAPLLPKPYRRIFQATILIAEMIAVGNNHRVGIRIEF